MRLDDRASITFLHRAFTAADDVGGTDSAQWRKAMGHSAMDPACHELRLWNEGRLVGAKRALKQQQVWAIRFWPDQHRRLRDRALFDLAVDSKLRGCDLVSGGRARDRAIIAQQKTKRPVQFELMDTARKTIRAWLERRGGTLNDFAFPSRNDYMAHEHTPICPSCMGMGNRHRLPPQDYGMHSLRRTKASIIYKATCNFRAVQILLGSANIDSTIRYLGVDVEDALELA